MTIQAIENLTTAYSDAQGELDEAVSRLQQAMEAARREVIPTIRRLAKKVATTKGKLQEVIEAEPELFVKPRTHVFAGIKVGMHLGKNSLEYDDEGAVIARIEKFFDGETAELLIKNDKSLKEAAVKGLEPADLKRIGVKLIDGEDGVIIKPVEDQIDKAVKAMQKAAVKVEEAIGA